MAERVENHPIFGPLPVIVLLYTPETDSLSIQAGSPDRIHESETVANGMVAHYDVDNTLVRLDLDDAQLVLKPILDAVLRKRATGKKIRGRQREGIHQKMVESVPLPGIITSYYSDTDTLVMEAGPPGRIYEGETIADWMVAHYDVNNSLVAVDWEFASHDLKPFLDAVLRKEQEKAAQAG